MRRLNIPNSYSKPHSLTEQWYAHGDSAVVMIEMTSVLWQALLVSIPKLVHLLLHVLEVLSTRETPVVEYSRLLFPPDGTQHAHLPSPSKTLHVPLNLLGVCTRNPKQASPLRRTLLVVPKQVSDYGINYN